MIVAGAKLCKVFYRRRCLMSLLRLAVIVAERQSALFLDCRAGGRASWTTLAIERDATSIAFDVHLEDGGVMDEAIDRCERHCLVWEDLAPFSEWLIGGDQH